MTNEVKFLQGQSTVLTSLSMNANTVYASTDKSVMGMGGQLYFGKPTLEYANDKIILWGVSGDTNTKLGEVDLTLDSFLEGATYIPNSTSAETAAFKWASGVSSSITQAQVTEAYTTAFGESFSGDKSAIVMVMHTEAASGDSHSVIVLPLGKLIGDVQTEIDTIEKGAGLKSDGSYSATTTANYISDATSLADADNKLDAAIKASTLTAGTVNGVSATVTRESAGTSFDVTVDTSDIKVADDFTTTAYQTELSGASAIASGDTVSSAFTKVETTISALTQAVLDNEKVDAAAVKALGNAAGTISADGTIAYTANTSDTYISGATSLADADDKLDAAIKELSAAYSLSSTKKTIDITTATTGTNIDVNLDEKTIKANTNGELGVVVASKSATSAVNLTTGDSGVDVVLTLEPTDSAMTLSQADGKLKATLALDNGDVSDTAGGIELTQSTSGVKAKLYWGTFGA